jgi:NAD/NADP transhydrogenase beta subunit
MALGSLSGLGSQATARQGNALGMLGVGSGILASLAAVGFPPAVLAQFAGVAAIGGTIGSVLGKRITATELPQMVAALHSVVGLAAVFTSIASVLADVSHISTLHLVTAYLGVLIGELCFYLPSLLRNLYIFARWNNIHRIYCCLLEISRTHVLKTIDASPTAPNQWFAFGS